MWGSGVLLIRVSSDDVPSIVFPPQRRGESGSIRFTSIGPSAKIFDVTVSRESLRRQSITEPVITDRASECQVDSVGGNVG